MQRNSQAWGRSAWGKLLCLPHHPAQCSSSQSHSALALMPGYQAQPYSFVCLCRKVGNTLQEIPYNFTGNETKQKGGFCSQ